MFYGPGFTAPENTLAALRYNGRQSTAVRNHRPRPILKPVSKDSIARGAWWPFFKRRQTTQQKSSGLRAP